MLRLLAVTATLAVTADASAVQLTKANCKTTIHFFIVLFFYLHAPPTTSNCLRLTRSPFDCFSPLLSRSINRITVDTEIIDSGKSGFVKFLAPW
jgi:hypothetical protein